MSAIPIVGPGIGIVRNNMKDAHNHGEPRDMALPLTYYWFYQKVRNKGLWDYKQFDPYWAAFGNFNFGATGYATGIPVEILVMGLDGHRAERELQGQNGVHGIKTHLMAMIHRISTG